MKKYPEANKIITFATEYNTQRYGIILLLIEYNPISDNMTLLFNDNEHCSEIVYRINDVSEILEEDGYFQQSLVQNLPLEYN